MKLRSILIAAAIAAGPAVANDNARSHGAYQPYYDSYNGQPRFERRWSARDPEIDRAQYNQRERIAEGMRSGALTQREAHRLLAEQQAIRDKERWYRADGVLSSDERADLRRDLNVASRHIYNEKHDAQWVYRDAQWGYR